MLETRKLESESWKLETTGSWKLEPGTGNWKPETGHKRKLETVN